MKNKGKGAKKEKPGLVEGWVWGGCLRENKTYVEPRKKKAT